MPRSARSAVAQPTVVWFVLLTFLTMFAVPVQAHPGRTDSSGCHTCRTNCAQWGLQDGQYHCHNGGGGGSTSSKKGDGNGDVVTWVVIGAATAAVLFWALHERDQHQTVDFAKLPGLGATCDGEGHPHSLLDHLKEHTVVSANPKEGTVLVKLRFAF